MGSPGAQVPHADAAVLGPGHQKRRGGVETHGAAGDGGAVGIRELPAQHTCRRIVTPSISQRSAKQGSQWVV